MLGTLIVTQKVRLKKVITGILEKDHTRNSKKRSHLGF